MERELIGPTAAGLRLGLGAQQVIKLAKSGRLPFVQTGRGKLFYPAVVEQLAAARQADPPQRGTRPAAK
jgi:hypothetical protein